LLGLDALEKIAATLRVKRQWLMLISRHCGIILLFFQACYSIIATYLCLGLVETPRKMLFVVSKLYHGRQRSEDAKPKTKRAVMSGMLEETGMKD